MSALTWKSPSALEGEWLQPANTLAEAMRRSVELARTRKQLSIERLADRLNVGHWTLYKWVQTGKMPATMIRPFEDACGTNLITRWLASAGQQLLVRMPTGGSLTDEGFQSLQDKLLSATRELLRFHRGSTDWLSVRTALYTALQALAFHLRNVRANRQPQLPFGGAT